MSSDDPFILSWMKTGFLHDQKRNLIIRNIICEIKKEIQHETTSRYFKIPVSVADSIDQTVASVLSFHIPDSVQLRSLLAHNSRLTTSGFATGY
jgi:hypothetical protein